ncbi:hypothetical protein CTJ15_07410 [Roseomonas sp. FDAARGOS_362]|nr:hypothetical protein CTJ15_07410 [Roseomonas sp. FDAARGOS_362]
MPDSARAGMAGIGQAKGLIRREGVMGDCREGFMRGGDAVIGPATMDVAGGSCRSAPISGFPRSPT